MFSKVVREIIFRILNKLKLSWGLTKDGFEYKLDDYCDLRCLLLDDHKELDEFMQEHLQAGSTYVDVGANNGYTCHLALKYIADINPSIFAFEPIERLFKRLAQTLTMRGVCCVPLALSHKKGTSTAFVCSNNSGAHTLELSFTGFQGNHYNNLQKVETVTYDAFDIDKADLVKIDVEGHEVNVLRGMSKCLEQNRIKALFIEVSESTYDSVVGLLENYDLLNPGKPLAGRLKNLRFVLKEKE